MSFNGLAIGETPVHTQIVLEALRQYPQPRVAEIDTALMLLTDALSDGYRADTTARAVEMIEALNNSGQLRGAAAASPALTSKCRELARVQGSKPQSAAALDDATRRLSLEVILGMDGVDALHRQSPDADMGIGDDSRNGVGVTMLTAATLGTVAVALLHAWIIRAYRK